MNKEEILKKSRAEQQDEGEAHAIRVGSNWAYIGMTLLYIFIIVLVNALDLCSIAISGKRILGDGIYSPSFAPLHGMYWFGKGLAELGKASVQRNKAWRFSGIVSTVMGVVFILGYIVFLAMSLETRG